MRTSGTTREIVLSITPEDIAVACRRYPEEKFSFSWLEGHFQSHVGMIREASAAHDSAPHSADRALLATLIDNSAAQFLEIFKLVDGYRRDQEANMASTQEHDRIAEAVAWYLSSAYSRAPHRMDSPRASPNNILDAVLLAQALPRTPPRPVATKEEEELILRVIKLARTAEADIPPILETVRRAGAEAAYKEYAQIFYQEARRHSRRIFTRYEGNIPPPKNKVTKVLGKVRERVSLDALGGSAERWFIGALAILGAGVYVVKTTLGSRLLGDFLEVSASGRAETVVRPDWAALPAFAAKVLAVLVLIYLLRFCSKQYTIHKHIAVTNRHRANVLNSFAVLYASVADEIPGAREQLTSLVATAVYQSFDTGFLSDKTPEIGILPLEAILGAAKSKP